MASADAVRPPRAWRWPPPLAHRLPPLRLELAAPPAGLVHPWGALALLLRAPSRALDRATSAHHALLDRAAASLTQSALLFPAGFFCDGWGDLDTPARLRRVLRGDRMRQVHALSLDDVQWSGRVELPAANARVQQGRFRSTLPDAHRYLPEESLDAFVELVTPLEWTQGEGEDVPRGAPNRPLVVLLPGTGEHGFLHRRASIALPLARMGIATLILEGPFYGRRRPSDQRGSKLRRVSDLPILGQATIEETKSLLAYFRDHYNFSRLVVAGSSMGGLHAAMTASVFPGEVGATAWLAPPSAAPVFADGLLAGSCNWDLLYQQHSQSLAPGQDADKASSEKDHVQEAKKRMREFLSITDIDNFGPPQRTDAVVFVVGTEDMYLGSTEPQWTQLQSKWDQASVRYVKTGHVSGILLEDEAYRQTIVEVIRALQRPAPRSSRDA